MQSRSISNIPRIAVALAVSIMLAFMPFTVNLEKYRITLERNEAHAIAPVFAGALAFLEEAAVAAGFASVGDFVATGVGITAVSTGMGIATEAGVKMGESASNNLDALVDAADYPAWDTLSSSEQESWGSSDNYNAAKYNSLMGAFGLGDDYARYQNTWGSFTPGEFQFSSSANNTLEQMQEIGSNWANGLSNTVQDITSLFKNEEPLYQYLGNAPTYEFNGQGVAGYPSGYPQNLLIGRTNDAQVLFKNGASNSSIRGTTNSVCYWLCFWVPASNELKLYGFESSDFTYNNKAVQHVNNYYGEAYWYGETRLTNFTYTSSNIPINYNWAKYQVEDVVPNMLPIILSNITSTEPQPTIVNYPANINEYETTNIYYPEEGITDTTDWDDLLTHVENIDGNLNDVIALLQHIDNDLHNLNIPGQPDLDPVINYLQHIDTDLHKFSFYNDGQLKVHDQGVWQALRDIWDLLAEIADNIGNWNDAADAPDLIGDFDFDELEEKVPDLLETISDLAPFGSILLLSEMYSILANYTQIESPELVFPFDFGGFDEQNHELIIDLSWLDDIKPLINFLCIAMLIIAIANATIRIVEIEAAS